MFRTQTFTAIPFALALLIWSGASAASPADNLAKSLTFRTVSQQDRDEIDYGEFDKLHDFLRATYPRVFSELDVEVINNYSLLIQWKGSDAAVKPILFTAHMDVVPIEPGTEADWEHPPFDGVVADGKVYGRGSLDDKVGVIGLLEAVEQLLGIGFQPRRGIVLAFGHDEEISGYFGAVALASRMQELGLHFSWMVDEGGAVLDGLSALPGRPIAMISIAEKRAFTVTLRARGHGGHSSNPPAVSTIGRLSTALAKIEQNPFPTRLVGPVESMLETLAPYNPWPNRFILGNLWLTGSLVASQMGDDPMFASSVRTTTALTMFNGGVKENVVPQLAEAKVNFRLLPGDSPEMVISRIEKLVDDPEVDIIPGRPMVSVPVAEFPGGGFAVIAEAANSVYPNAVVAPALVSGATDARHYASVADSHYRFHGVKLSSHQLKSFHGTNEYVDIESFENSIEIAVQMMRLGSQ